MARTFRLVAWNIRAGGGTRSARIAEALIALQPDAIVLSEFRSTPPSQGIAARLASMGFGHQIDTCREVARGQNALLIASHTPVRRVGLRRAPDEPGRWCMVRLQTNGLAIGAMHIPNQHTGRKPGYHDAVLDLAKRWRGGPAILAGDTNSGQIEIDEETPVFNKRTHNWFDRLNQTGWADGFRHLHPLRRDYTWYSHRGNGFRLDQAFLSPALLSQPFAVRHIWPGETAARRDVLSDHAALVLDIGVPG